MRAVLWIALLIVAQFGITALGVQHTEGDIAWQQWLGASILDAHQLPRSLGHETFTAAGAPWVAQEWLFSTLLTLAIRGGVFPIFAFAIAVGAGVTLVLCAMRARVLGASWPSIWIVTTCTAIAMEQMFGIRAQIAAWPLFASLLLFFEYEQRVRWYSFVVVFFWANLHASVFLAPVYAALRAPKAMLLVSACAIATLVTPFGFGLFLYALHLIESPIRHMIIEWRAPRISDPSFSLGFVPVAVAAWGSTIADRRAMLRHLPVMAFFTVFAFGAVRNIPLATMALAPYAACFLTHLLSDNARIVALLRERAITAIAGAAIAVTIPIIGLRAQAIESHELPKLPERQVAAAALLPGTRHLFCEDFGWCSLALKYSNVRTFIDGRCDPFPVPLWDAYDTVLSSSERRMSVLDRYGIDTIVAKSDGRLDRALRANGDWRVVLSGRSYTLFARERQRVSLNL